MLKKKNIILFISFLMVLSVVSGIITYRMTVKESIEKPIVEASLPEHEKIITLTQENNNKGKELDFAINNVFAGLESLMVRSYVKTSSPLEINGKDKGVIIANFKALQKEMTNEREFKNQIIDFELYTYQIDIDEKNIKVRFYSKIPYMIIEDTENENIVYKLEKEENKAFISLLDDIYMDKILEKVLYPIPEKVHLKADDENAVYLLSKKEIKHLFSTINISSIEKQEEYIGTPSLYPNYNISFKRDLEYIFYIKNDELMIIDTPIIYLYCKYDKALWDFIVDKLPKENKALENDFRFLLKAERVIFKDLDGMHDFQNDSYYNIELPRQILKSEPKKMGKVSDIELDDELRFVLKFIVESQSKEVLIYNNYIVYADDLYYSKNIYEHISSTLMIP